MSDPLRPYGQYVACQGPLSLEFSRQEYWSGLPCPPPADLPDPGIEPRSPVLQADSLPTEPPSKPKNTGVGSLSLLQGIFPTQELNWSLLHCRWIFYQLSYQRSPELLCAVLCLVAQSCPTRCDLMDCNLPGSSVHGDFPGKNTGVSCHALLQGIFPIQGSNPGLPLCRQILY